MTQSRDDVPTTKALFGLTWPMTLKAIFLHGVVVIDGLLVSALGEVALAAMGLAAALGGMVLGTIFAFAHALQIRAAQAYGTGDQVTLKSVLVSGLALGVTVGLVGIVILLALAPSVLTALAPSPEIAATAWTYLTIFLLVIFGESIGQSIGSVFNGCGRTKIPLVGYCLSVPANIGASYALIHGLWGLPAMGVAGAATGSALAVAVQSLYLLVQMLRVHGHLRRVVGWSRGSFAAALKRHMTFSLPIAATFISANIAGPVCTLIYAKLPLHAFAALTLITPWNQLAGQISMQWTQATGIFVAQLLGKRAPESVLNQFLSTAWRGAFVAAGIVAAIFLAMCLSVDVLYPNLAPETRSILWGFLPLMMLLQVPRATNAICGNTLRASGDTVYVMHIFVWSQWACRVPLIALGVLYLDLSAFWILSIFLLEEMVKFWPFHSRLWRGHWKQAEVLT